jgi:hypothetical protein
VPAVALGGSVLGGTMTACTLPGRQLPAGIRGDADLLLGAPQPLPLVAVERPVRRAPYAGPVRGLLPRRRRSLVRRRLREDG